MLRDFQMTIRQACFLLCLFGVALGTLCVVRSRFSKICKPYPRPIPTLLTYDQFSSVWLKESKTLKTTVPPFLWRTGWHQLSDMPGAMVDAMSSFTEMAPRWIQVYCTDADQENFLRQFFPLALGLWMSLHAPAFRADLWRLLVLEQFGGLYMDLGQSLLHPLESFFDPDLDQFLCVLDRIGPNKVPRLFQATLGAYPQHPLIVAMASKVLNNVRSKTYGEDPLDITGPTAVGRAVLEVLNTRQLPPVGKHEILSPLVIKMTVLEHRGAFRVVGLDGLAQVIRTKFPDYDRVMYSGHRACLRYGDLWRDRKVYGEQ
jgi:hypothetical protein